jgi:putative ATP-dependent endonuclease of OLD family
VIAEVGRHLAPGSGQRVEELKRFDKEASDVVGDFFPGLKLHLDIPVPGLKDLFKQGSVKVSEQGREAIRDFTSLGHGAQRSIQMALVRYLADSKVADGDQVQRRLLLVEEPELFLHPQAIEQIRMALESLSNAGYQVVFATHSPMMIDRSAVASTRIVRKALTDGKTRVMPSLREALGRRVESEDKRLHTLFELENASGWLFSDKALLAEGKTEKRILPDLYRAVTGKSLAADKISVLDLGGAGSVPGCLEALKELGLKACAVTDFDFALNQAVKLGFIEGDDGDLRACLQQIKDLSKADSSISIGSNGRPVNSAEKKATHVYRYWAKTEAGQPVAMALHQKLKEAGIWTWPTGDIESVLGLAGEKSETEWAEFCRSLERKSLEDCVDEVELVKGMVSWLGAG